MRKIICFILMLSVLGLNGFAVFAETGAGTQNSDAEYIIDVFGKLGVISFNDNGEFGANEKITRGEFAEYIVKLTDVAPLGKTVRWYSDVSIDHWAASSICTLADNGIVVPAAGEKFYPDADLTYADALKILLDMAGYSQYSDAKGGYPYGYIAAAKSLKVDKNVSYNDSLTRLEAISLAYDVFNIPTYSITGIARDIEYDKDENTLFKRYRSLCEKEDIIYAVCGESLLDGVAVSEHRVMIGNEMYTINSDINTEKLIGKCVKVLYEENSGKGGSVEGNVIALCIIDDTSEKYVLSSDISSYNEENGKITYFNSETGKDKSVAVKNNAAVIYNGKTSLISIGEVIEQFLSGERNGSIRVFSLLGKNYVIVESYENLFVNYIDSNFEKIYGSGKSISEIDLTKYESLRIADTNGKEIEFEKIGPKSVLSIGETDDGKNVKIIVSTQCVTGVVTAIEGRDKIFVDGEEYGISESFYNRFPSGVTAGAGYTFYLDAFNNIASARVNSDTYNVGYLLDCYWIEDKDGAVAGIKLFTENSEVKFFEFAEKVRVDGVAYSKKDGVWAPAAAIPGMKGIVDLKNLRNDANSPVVEQQVLRYRVNKDGRISALDTYNVSPLEDKNNTLTKYTENISNRYTYYLNPTTYRFGTNIMYSTTRSTLFSVPLIDGEGHLCIGESRQQNNTTFKVKTGPSTYAEPQDYMYSVNKPQFNNGQYCVIDRYDYDSANIFADVIVAKTSEYNLCDYGVMVSDICKAVDKNGDSAYKVKGIANGESVEYIVLNPADITGIKEGDIVRGYIDGNGNISYLSKVFDSKTMQYANQNSPDFLQNSQNNYPLRPDAWYGGYKDLSAGTEYYNIYWQMSKGYAFKKDENVVSWTYDLPDDMSVADETFDFSDVSYASVYDKNGRVYVGSVNDIAAYESAGNDCSLIVFATREGSKRQLFIYK